MTQRISPTSIRWIKSCIMLLVLAGMLTAFYQQREALFRSFQMVNSATWLILALMHTPIVALGGLAFYILTTYQSKIKLLDALGLSFIASGLNQILPYRPGMVYRFAFLKAKYQMALSLFAAIMLLYFILTLTIGCLFTLLGWWQGELYAIDVKHYIWVLVIICMLLLFASIPSRKTLTLEDATHSSIWAKLLIMKQNLLKPYIVGCNIFIFLVMHLLISCSLLIIFKALDYEIGLYSCIFFAGMLSLSSIIHVTPGNLGVSEGLLASLTHALYQDFSLGLAVSLIFRMTQWIPVIILGLYFSLKLEPKPIEMIKRTLPNK